MQPRFTGSLALWAYLAAWILLAPRPTRHWEDGAYRYEPEYEDPEVEMEYDERYHDYRPRKVFRYSDSSSVRLERAKARLLESRCPQAEIAADLGYADIRCFQRSFKRHTGVTPGQYRRGMDSDGE